MDVTFEFEYFIQGFTPELFAAWIIDNDNLPEHRLRRVFPLPSLFKYQIEIIKPGFQEVGAAHLEGWIDIIPAGVSVVQVIAYSYGYSECLELVRAEIERAFQVESRPRAETRESAPGKSKGRYRLTEDDIKARKAIVRRAKQIKKSNQKMYWKEIAKMLDISERTLRDWRHNPLYQ